ncbi:MAG: hypothetical protein HY720_29405 [Planctomycetes bacterium]|nr:hypothetical protein [Planctomycetota bacterium]
MRTIRILVLALFVLALAPAAFAQSSWDFESDVEGQPPAGFEFSTTLAASGGEWKIVDDGGNKVLAQTDTSPTERRFAMAVVKDSVFRDLKLSVRGKAVSGDEDRAVGLVWRWRDPDNYYVARTNVLERNVRLYRVVNGNRIKFAGVEDQALAPGTWQTFAVEHRGSGIKVFLDGRLLFEAEDETFSESGKVGLWVKADSKTYFDDLTVEELK